jgi:hypothetical protein
MKHHLRAALTLAAILKEPKAGDYPVRRPVNDEIERGSGKRFYQG